MKQREADLVEAEHLVLAAKTADDGWVTSRTDADTAYQQAAEALAQARERDLRADFTRRIADANSHVAALTDVIPGSVNKPQPECAKLLI